MLIIAWIFYAAGLVKPADGARRAAIYVDGELFASAVLRENAEDIEITTGYGTNVVSVYEDGAAVTYADCPSRECVRAGKASVPGGVIACLPHRLLVRIESEIQGDIDAVAK